MKKLNLFFAVFGGVLGTLFFIHAYTNQSIFLLIIGLMCVIGGVFGVVGYFKPEKL